ncbi:MAG: neutral zinc metallopeptidase [Thermomicrobiales bacterium]|nr:neutral zinc metallopeptidase [Thermomicrobiales bacterium]
MHHIRISRLFRTLVPFLFVLGILFGPTLSANVVATAAANATEETQINRSLVSMSQAQREGDYHLLYDLMLPQARMLIPRQAFVNWWPTAAPSAPADVITVDSITFSDITYPLTDTDFGNVATVEYEYTSVDGDDISLTVQLAEIGGVWRWMPDLTPDDLPAIQAQAGFTVNYTTAYSTPLYQELDMFWAQIFSDWGMEYRSPVDMIGVKRVGTQTGCGPIDDLDEVFAHYCTADEIIYFNPEMKQLIIDRIGDIAWQMVIAHEWGHHIQNISGMYVTKSPELFGGNYSIEHELQADCLSGVFLQDTIARGTFLESDLPEVEQMTELGGDAAGTNWDDITAHGSSDQRRQSFYTGLDDGLRGCNLSKAD